MKLFGDTSLQRVESLNLAGFDSKGMAPFAEPDVKDGPVFFPVGDFPNLRVPLNIHMSCKILYNISQEFQFAL